MQILMATNIYKPYTGGVQRSIESFKNKFSQLGHSVLIIAPKAEATVDDDDREVFRVSSIKNFNDTNFPVTIPLPGELTSRIEQFKPDIVHSHFPFIVGSAAMRIAANYDIPLVFTYHTMYEQYIHYINSDSDRVRSFVKNLTTGYTNLCDAVIAPSEAVKKDLIARGVVTDIEVIPTGVDFQRLNCGNGERFRKKFNINSNFFVAGYTGRLAKEKNLMFLVEAVSVFLKSYKNSIFIAVGDGAVKSEMEKFFLEKKLSHRVIFTGTLDGQDLVDAYHAMDVFAFSSKSETQGMVLTEAMAAGLPVAALEASGVNDVLQDGVNGFKIQNEDKNLFAQKLIDCAQCNTEKWKQLKQNAEETARMFSIDISAKKVLNLYERLTENNKTTKATKENEWNDMLNIVKAEWDIFLIYIKAVGTMISENQAHGK